MSILALFVFYLPPDSGEKVTVGVYYSAERPASKEGEKVSLGITVLLSFSVFLLRIAENVPKTSDCIPLIGKQRFMTI